MEIVEREASRLLVISPAGTVLLLRLEPTFRDPFWVTPGGGLDDGETHEEAALRELREEVGRDDLTLGPWIWTRFVEFTWEQLRFRQHERTFLVEVAEPFDPVRTRPDAEPIVGGAWFTYGQIATIDEAVYPLDLATLLERLLRDGLPEHAIDLGASVED